jgi:dUTP pyrophosphatase
MDEKSMIVTDDDGAIELPAAVIGTSLCRALLVSYVDPSTAHRIPVKMAMPGDCGIDLYNAQDVPVVVPPNESVEIPAGIRIKIPFGHCGFVRQRSSTFSRRGLLVVDGVIDSGYTGPIFTHVYNPALNGRDFPVLIQPWERISQLVVLPIPTLSIQVVESLPKTVRGEHGFGSTGL